MGESLSCILTGLMGQLETLTVLPPELVTHKLKWVSWASRCASTVKLGFFGDAKRGVVNRFYYSLTSFAPIRCSVEPQGVVPLAVWTSWEKTGDIMLDCLVVVWTSLSWSLVENWLSSIVSCSFTPNFWYGDSFDPMCCLSGGRFTPTFVKFSMNGMLFWYRSDVSWPVGQQQSQGDLINVLNVKMSSIVLIHLTITLLWSTRKP